MQKSMKYLATSTMQEVSSITIMPPEPMMEPALAKRFVVDRHIEKFSGQAAAGRTAGLHCLEAAAAGNAAADLEDDFAQRDAHRHFDQAGVQHASGKREDLGAFALLGADLRVPLAAIADDGRNVGVGFDVIDEGRLAEQAFLRGIRRARTRRAPLAFDRGDQRSFFAADEGAGAQPQIDVEAEAGSADARCPAGQCAPPGEWRYAAA